MLQFQHIESSVLMDLLSFHTARYTRMMMEGSSHEEFNYCRETIELLQKEIKFRNAECDIIIKNPSHFRAGDNKGR
jgi:hypothetical protein